MKRFLILGLIALLAVTGGMFAYTFTTATATIAVVAPTSDFAEVTAANVTGLAPNVFGKFGGTWPSGTLYNIAPDPEYNGDLVIQAYLVNAGELLQWYQHLNMTLEFWDTDNSTADKQGIIQVLNLQNSRVEFLWTTRTTANYTIELTGGGYRLHPYKNLVGVSVQPQLWLEITQR